MRRCGPPGGRGADPRPHHVGLCRWERHQPGDKPALRSSPAWQRVVSAAPRHHGPNTTLLASLTPAGITATISLQGVTDRGDFEVVVAQMTDARAHPDPWPTGDLGQPER